MVGAIRGKIVAAGSTITARTELRRKVKVEIPDVGVYEVVSL